MIALVLLALVQERPATVGDTVWLETRVPLAPRQIVRPQTWDLGEIGQVLGPPAVDLTPDSAIVRYPVAFWFPGRHAVVVPGPIVVNPEGRSDTLASRRLAVEILSVLPPAVRRDTVPPRPAAGLVAQARRSWLPLGVFWALLAAVAAVVGWQVRRRREPLAVAAPPPVAPPEWERLLDRWQEAGETRVTVDGWARLLETRAAGGDPAAADLVERLDSLGFRADADPDEVAAAIDSARDRGRP
ncbi:MAG: hypothetical protein R2882_05195 [Gemmatimonadales bacterium]